MPDTYRMLPEEMRRLSDERLGQVLARHDHVRGLPEVNPVLWTFLRELSELRPRFAGEVFDAGAFLLDLLGAAEDDAERVGLHTAIRVLAEVEFDGGRHAYQYLARVAEEDVLLRLSLDALLAYSDRSRRPRTRPERDAVAIALYVLLRCVKEQEEARELGRAVGI